MKLPSCWGKCACKYHIMPMPGWAPWGRCGVCKQVPEYAGEMNEEEWPDDEAYKRQSPAA